MASDAMEVVVLRLDHLKDRPSYVSTLRTWIQETKLNGRLVSRSNLHLVVVEGASEAIDKLLNKFETEPIDTNARNERCIDRFYDVVGRETREVAKLKPGFTDMQLLNDAMMESLIVKEWGMPKDWLESARATERTKRFAAWKEQAKLARKQNRRRTAQERDETKQKNQSAKRQKVDKADNSEAET
ncbi:hypothetical protein LEN26_009211 [Aphanomyces euteiches]|nr:hypothetical protein AeMF1_014042 [Aphanomyces euteiches]KAH9127737.1 hypothetical protein LEN26_009211 [Aphanomyces euteiches]KAH9164829.1 hypothetical protein AeNC1_018623 [Aphanomyces euteiches]